MADRSDALARYNFRDLGGLGTTDGRTTRPGLLLRSEFPSWAAHDIAAADRVSTVVDLRRDEERDMADVDWAAIGARVHRISLGSGTTAFAQADSGSYLASAGDALVEAVRAVLAPGALPVHFFCAAGKDRTGLLAIVLLALLGVSEADIEKDFAASGDGMLGVTRRLREQEYYRRLLAGYADEAFIPNPDALTAVLSWLKSQGGAETWALGAGIPREWIEEFRDQLLVAESPVTGAAGQATESR